MEDLDVFAGQLKKFLDTSFTPYHAVRYCVNTLKQLGAVELEERDVWHLEGGKSYFVQRSNSSLIAFSLPDNFDLKASEVYPLRAVAAHTDSPGLKLKVPGVMEDKESGFLRLNTEVYGSPLLSTWFDRELILAGIAYAASEAGLVSSVLTLSEIKGVLPHLAIHLNRSANDQHSIQKQKELFVFFPLKSEKDFLQKIEEELKESLPFPLLAYDLNLCTSQPAEILGSPAAWVVSGRLDNLLSCFVGLRAFAESMQMGIPRSQLPMLLLFDHEEVGSTSSVGANGPFALQVIERLLPCPKGRWAARGLLISCDNAHALHPNYPEKMDPTAYPLLNHGPAIKLNGNQNYATSAESRAWFQHLCGRKVPLQTYYSRNDIPCGNTLGPFLASSLGLSTLDVGAPTFAMHSAREMAGVKDAAWLLEALTQFYVSSDFPPA